jgi:hypothetical protein
MPHPSHPPVGSSTVVARISPSARSSEGSADSREFVLEHIREVRNHQNHGTHDKSNKHDIFRHGRALFIVAEALEQFPHV